MFGEQTEDRRGSPQCSLSSFSHSLSVFMDTHLDYASGAVAFGDYREHSCVRDPNLLSTV